MRQRRLRDIFMHRAGPPKARRRRCAACPTDGRAARRALPDEPDEPIKGVNIYRRWYNPGKRATVEHRSHEAAKEVVNPVAEIGDLRRVLACGLPGTDGCVVKSDLLPKVLLAR